MPDDNTPRPRSLLSRFFIPGGGARLRIAILLVLAGLAFAYGALFQEGFDPWNLFQDIAADAVGAPVAWDAWVQEDAVRDLQARAGNLAPPPPPAADWSQFLGPERDGRADGGGIARKWPDDGLPVLWSVEVQPGFGGPSVAGDEVFVLERVDNEQDVLRCLSLDTGEELWSAGYDAPGRTGYNGSRTVPTVTDTHVYTAGPFGHVACWDREKQALAWRKDLIALGGRAPSWGYSSSPLLLGETVVFTAQATDFGLIAYHAVTGEELWRTEAVGRENFTSPAAHSFGGRTLILYLAGPGLFGFDPATGETVTRYTGYKARGAIPAPTRVGEDYLFLTAGYNSGSQLVEVEVGEDGAFSFREVFAIQRDGAQIHQALLVGEHLYANFNRNENQRRPAGLVCIGLDGTLCWNTGRDPDVSRGNVICIDGLLLMLGGDDGVLRLVEPNPEGYTELAQMQVFDGLKRRDNQIWAPMAFSDGRLLLRSQTTMKCLDLRDPWF